MLSRCFLDFSVGVRAFVIGMSQISFFFSFNMQNTIKHPARSGFPHLVGKRVKGIQICDDQQVTSSF